jgi:iron complex outermembrane receptor protein
MKKQANKFKLHPIFAGMAMLGLVLPHSAFAQQVTDVGIVNATGGTGEATNPKNYDSVKLSPVRTSLDVARPVAELSQEYIDNFTAPMSNFANIANGMLPGAYGISSNGPGNNDDKIWFRGFKDGNWTMTFDGIPYNDTNDPTHHSQAFFPAPFIGGITSDRSPGTAASIGPANFGGTVGLLSRPVDNEHRVSAFYNFGSFNTNEYGMELATGYLENAPATKILFNIHHMDSDGAQTYNRQYRDGASFKLESALTPDTTMTIFASWVHYLSNSGGTIQPSTYAVYTIPGAAAAVPGNYKGDLNYYNSNNPARADYLGYNKYDVTTSFNYLGFKSNLGDGWKLDNKTYFNYYSNQQNYANISAPDQTSASLLASSKPGVDKLNSYHTMGNILRLSKEFDIGTLRTGIQTERSDTPRHQTYVNYITGQQASGGVIFNEDFQTTILQPYAEFAWKATKELTVTPGVKYNSFTHSLTQYADSGTVGNLGGAPSVMNSRTYTDVLPFLDARYMIQKNWSVYAQYSTGDLIPPTSTYDVSGSLVGTLPDPMKTKTYQIGSVFQTPKYSVDFDVFQTNADVSYSSQVVNGVTSYYQAPATTYKGVEGSGNVMLARNLNLYLNAMYYSSTYDTTGLSVANVPQDMETIGLFYRENNWSLGGTVKRIGAMWQDNTKATQINQAYQLDPMILTSLSANYMFSEIPTFVKSMKLRVGIDNIFDNRYIAAVKFGSATSVLGASSTDTVLYTSGRSLYAGVTGSF